MANTYCTLDQVKMMYDLRTILELSSDDNRHEGNPPTLQFLLDMQASEFDSFAQGRYGAVPLTGTIPLVITKWVGATACRRFFARRTDMPKQVEDDARWADQWMKDLLENKIGLPNVARVSVPQRVLGERVFHDRHHEHSFDEDND
jgi:hypothetical protein